MKTTNLHPVASSVSLSAEPSEVPAGPHGELPDPRRVLAEAASAGRLEALEHAWESGERWLTAAECSAMSVQQLSHLCDEAFAALDADFPAWGARDEYEVLCAELTSRAAALQVRSTSAHD